MKIILEPTPTILDDKDRPMRTAKGIAAIRKRYGFTASVLADICIVATRTVNGWEQGRTVPRYAFMIIKNRVLDNWNLNNAYAFAKNAGVDLNKVSSAEREAYARRFNEEMKEKIPAASIRDGIVNAIIYWGHDPEISAPEIVHEPLSKPPEKFRMSGSVQQWINTPGGHIYDPFPPEGDIRFGFVTYDAKKGFFRIDMGQQWLSSTYDIEAKRIDDATVFLDFLWQLHAKPWITAQHLKDFLDCVTCRIRRDHGDNPQSFFKTCGGENRK